MCLVYGMNWTYIDIDSDCLDLCREVGRRVARIIALALDLEADFFDKPEMLGHPIAIMRLLRYGS